MKLSNPKLEYTALKTITSSRDTLSAGKLLAMLKAQHFWDEGSLEVFNFIKSHLKKYGSVPTWREIETSSRISDPLKAEVKAFKEIKPLKDTAKIKSCYDELESFRKGRVLFDISVEAQESLNKDQGDLDDIFANTVSKLNNASHGSLADVDIVKLGDPKSSSTVLEEVLKLDKTGNLIPTGFAAFDSENGGLPVGGLTIIAATSGGGKSVMAVQITKNMAEAGFGCHVIPLEMSKTEMFARYISNISKIDVRKFIGGLPLTQKESDKARKDYIKWETDVNKGGGHVRIYEPDDDLDIEELLALIEPYGDDVILIDYVSLLGGVDGDDSWQKLSAAARYAKRWATLHKRQVILLAQLSDDGQIRYSKGLKEHASNMWTWVFNEDVRELGEIMVQQQKARNQRQFEFPLKHDFAHMVLEDTDEFTHKSASIKRLEDKVNKVRKKKKKYDDDAPKKKKKKSVAEEKTVDLLDKLKKKKKKKDKGSDTKLKKKKKGMFK